MFSLLSSMYIIMYFYHFIKIYVNINTFHYLKSIYFLDFFKNTRHIFHICDIIVKNLR